MQHLETNCLTLAFLRLFFEAFCSGAVVGAGIAGANSSSSSLSMAYLALRCASAAAWRSRSWFWLGCAAPLLLGILSIRS